MDSSRGKEKILRIASIDIGTNTVLLLVADVEGDGTLHVVEHQQRMPRLGRDVDEKRVIQTSAFDRIAWILDEYRNLAKQLGADRLVAGATAAVRDAVNKDELISYLKQTTGMAVEIISGEDEASLTYLGAVSSLPKHAAPAVVIDIGGGSTEVSFPRPTDQSPGHISPAGRLKSGVARALERKSFPIGCVRLTERFFKHNPPEPEEIRKAVGVVSSEFSQLRDFDPSAYMLLGVAGTATTLACIDQGLLDFEVEKVSGYVLPRQRVEHWLRKLGGMATAEIRSLSNATEGRADILTAGVLVLSQFMNQFRIEKMTVSERGVRYGLILREWENSNRGAA
jgi:exopolyphosphatase/guanosine-5'-triphosphate,3'-diphosphate pyrophosphatase